MRVCAPSPVRALAIAGLLVGSLIGLGACSGTVTEEDLQKWTNNDIGLERITEVVTDVKQPMATRIRALEVVIEKGLPTRIRMMVDAIAEPADRDAVIDGLVGELLAHVEKRTETQYDAKDALLVLQRYIDKERFDKVRQTIAEWAFRDISWDSTAEQVKVIGTRISHGQIRDLGKYGWEGAAILISHGLNVTEPMLEFLAEGESDETAKLMVKALERHHKALGNEPIHLAILQRTGHPEAAGYLLELYLDGENPTDLRIAAYDLAVGMLNKETVKKGGKKVGDLLLKMMDSPNAEDRWLGALNLVALEGVARLPEILAAFKDDKVYAKAKEDPGKSVIDLCLDIYEGGHSKKANPIFLQHLKTQNRIVQAISIVCLKANRAYEAKPALDVLAKFDGQETDVTIADFLGEELTLGRLAKNASEGLDLLALIDKDKAAGKLDAEQARNKALLTIFPLSLVGEPYPKVVEARYQQWLVTYKKKDAPTPEKAPEGKPGDKAPEPDKK